MSPELVDLSRLQFAATALYHFLFVPLTLGLSFVLLIMELLYVMTGNGVYKDMVKFWGKLFGINFALGVATGITLEFQFGTNWAYYSHYVGDIFGVPLAVEGLMAFFLEATFVGLFFFGWERLSRLQHLAVTGLLALGTNLSALWILIANGWMQNPVGAHFNYHAMRMEISDFSALLLNPVAQVKFIHTVAAGYVTGSVFVMGISAYFLLHGRHRGFAMRSFAVACGFGLAGILSTLVLGDESGYTDGEVQKVKLAAIESEWHTEQAPASFTFFGIPDEKTHRTDYAIRIPYVLGIIATRSLDEKIAGLDDLLRRNERRVRDGMVAYGALQKLRAGDTSPGTRAIFDRTEKDLGYGLLLKKYAPNVVDATAAQVKMAAADTIPHVAPLFFSFRFMVGIGLWLLLLFALAFYFMARRRVERHRWLLRAALYSIPLPWIAAELGWVVSEYGRQPWTISGILPTRLSTSTLPVSNLYFSLGGLVLFYTVLLIVELRLMFKYARLGPTEEHAPAEQSVAVGEGTA